ncbi:hypothetical protein GCM10022198_25760 [Klugiella xanthotipulae]|nr:M23 family metallopeptidase [Klugiella xanthotipulae]
MAHTVHTTSTRRRALRRGLTVALVGSLFAAGLNATAAQPAYALDLPTWSDVQAAKKNEAATAAKVTEIEGLIVRLQDEVEATKVEAERTFNIYVEAQQKFQEADVRFTTLTDEAAASKKKAEDAADQAASVASQMYRTSGTDQTLELFLDQDAAAADGLLSRLSMMTRATERNTALYEDAQVATNNAASLGEQAQVAKDERERLSQEAETAMQAAAAAAQASQEKLAAQEAQQVTLNAQLDALKDKTTETVKGYEERVRIEAEQRRKAEAAAAAKRAAEEAAWRASQGSSAGSGAAASPGGGGGAPVVGTGVWYRPSNGRYTSGYGYRNSLCANYGCSGSFHTGSDIANSCGSSIFAAAAGVVTYAGWANGGYGNMVEISHGGGIKTRYGHIMNGGVYVSLGQSVAAGQVVAGTGTTGMSTGCHVHFETYVNGSHTNPVPFMAARGVNLY